MKKLTPLRKKAIIIVYIAIFVLITVFPVVSMVFYTGGEYSDNRTLSDKPRVIEDGTVNLEYPEQLETYISEHVGLRQEIITLWNMGQYYIFGTSGVPKVTVGRDGWLFFTEAVDDIRGKTLVSDRAVYRVARTVELMNDYAEQNGQLFIFTVAPNKTSVYPQQLRSTTYISPRTNLTRLNALLGDKDYYLDLYELFCSDLDLDTVQYYYKYDSHWNGLGGMEVYRALQMNLSRRIEGYAYNDYAGCETRQVEHTGDLGKMLLPGQALCEYEQAPVIDRLYTCERPITDPLYYQIETFADLTAPSLYMFRDSFGSALIEPVSNNFSHVFYSTSIPYKLDEAQGYDVVAVEIVERNLMNIVANPPEGAMSPVRAAPSSTDYMEKEVVCSVGADETTFEIWGEIGEGITLDDFDNIYIEAVSADGSVFFEVYPICPDNGENDRGFYASLPSELFSDAELFLHIGTEAHTAAYPVYAA